MGDDGLPDPLTPPDCDLRDVPFPDGLLVELMGDAFGLSAQEARALARSYGMVEVPGGWRKPVQ